VARLEAAEHVPTLETLVRLTERLGMTFQIEIRPTGVEQPDQRPGRAPTSIVERVSTAGGVDLVLAAG
jgi:hypothetical protein